jgi:hypothetical protein
MHQHEALMDFSGSGTIQNVLLALKMYERWRSWIVFTTGALVGTHIHPSANQYSPSSDARICGNQGCV